MSFSASGSNPPVNLTNNGFFPTVNSGDFSKTLKVDGTVSSDRLVFALTHAIAEANSALVAWQIEKQLAGYATLAAVPADAINGVSRLVHLYLRAVYSFAKADLAEKFRDIDTTAKGNSQAERLECTVDDYRRDALWALADLQAKPRTVVELI